MSILDRINRRIADRIRGKMSRIEIAGRAITLADGTAPARRHDFADLARVTLVHRDVFVGDSIALLLCFADGAIVEVAMDDPVWPDLVAALDATGRIPLPAPVWQAQAIADGPDAPPRDLF